MKNIITLCIFAFALLIGNQSFAQDQLPSPEAIAKEKTHAIYQQLELDGKQQGLVWRAFVQHEKSMRERINGQNLTDAEITESKAKVNDALLIRMKDILTEKQYNAFVALQKK